MQDEHKSFEFLQSAMISIVAAAQRRVKRRATDA
jgi:hypothetical protein